VYIISDLEEDVDEDAQEVADDENDDNQLGCSEGIFEPQDLLDFRMILNNIILFVFILANGIQFFLKINPYFTYELLGVQHFHGFSESDAFDKVEESAVSEFEDLWQGHQRNKVIPKLSLIEINRNLFELSNWVDRISGLVLYEKLEDHVHQK